MIKFLLLLIAFLLIVTACDDSGNNIIASPSDFSYSETQFEIDYVSSNVPVTVSFFKGTSNDFYRYDKNGEDFTLYHYSDSIALISSLSGKLASGTVKAIIPENKVLYYTDNSVGVISEEGDKSVTFEEKVYDVDFQKETVGVLTESKVKFYNTNMEFLNESDLIGEYYYGRGIKVCNGFAYIYADAGSEIHDQNGNSKEVPFDCSGDLFEEHPLVGCHFSFSALFCSEEQIVILASSCGVYLEAEASTGSNFTYTIDNSLNVETKDISEHDDVISFTDKNYLYYDSQSFIVDTLDLNDFDNRTELYTLPLLHSAGSENSFINNGGNILIADTAIYPYIEIISPEGELLYTKLFEINEKHAENIKSFTETSEKDGYAFVGNGYSLIDDSSYHGMYDIVQGKILAGDQSYSSSFSGTSHDEKGYKIINNKDGYVTTSLEKVYEDGSVKNKLKISFQNKDFQKTASSVKEVEEDSAHMIEKIDDEIYLITINNGIQMTIYNESGEEESSKIWNIEKFNPIRFKTLIKKDGYYLLSYSYNLYYGYECGGYYDTGTESTDSILKLSLTSDKAIDLYFIAAYTKGDMIEKDGKTYFAYYYVNGYTLACAGLNPESEEIELKFTLGTIKDNGTFSQEKEFDLGEYGRQEIIAHKPTGNFYVFFENKVEVYNSSWNMIAKIDDWKYNDSLYRIDDSGNIIILLKEDGTEGKAIIKIAKYTM